MERRRSAWIWGAALLGMGAAAMVIAGRLTHDKSVNMAEAASGDNSAGLTVVEAAEFRLAGGEKQFQKLPPVSVTLTINADRQIGSINPNIYGMAQPGPEHFRQLRIPLTRWGGNPSTRYNWEKGNAWNSARDWKFLNGNYGNNSAEDRKPSGVADKAIAGAKAVGSEVLITIPTMGWVARDDNGANGSLNVPAQGGPPVAAGSEAIAGYDPSANRRRVSQKSLPRKGRAFSDPPDLTDDVVYQDEWVFHLTHRFGKANAGGVRYYAMDNEPELWSSTHTDMHPVQPDYDDLLHQFLTYASAVKDVDAGAQITGPTTWGWTGYFYSPRDQGLDNYATHADRKAHGDMPFLPWFLQQVATHDREVGRRTLDVLDIHFYPQGDGIYAGKTDLPSNAMRLRSTASLFDPKYRDESWIGDAVELIPRMKRWIVQYYPGTKLGLTEWNWGADTTLNGGLAVADVLGILGREQVEMACYWAVPGVGTPGFYAYKMYRNADGAGHGFGDFAISASSSEPERVSVYGSLDKETGLPVVMLINKTPSQTANITLALEGGKTARGARVYRYDEKDLKSIQTLPETAITGGKAALVLPPYSITLLRCK